METPNKSNKKGVVIGVLLVLIIGIVTVLASRKSPEVNQVPVTVPNTSNTTVSNYKDGSYSATGTYMSPGGQDEISVLLILKDDIVADVTVDVVSADNTSKRYISKFVSGIKQVVVGKKISDINVTKVSGSSLTGDGFNDVVTQIKAQAKKA